LIEKFVTSFICYDLAINEFTSILKKNDIKNKSNLVNQKKL